MVCLLQNTRLSPEGLGKQIEGFALTGVVPAVVNESSLAKHPVFPFWGVISPKPLHKKLP
jgi:hypothetical protein